MSTQVAGGVVRTASALMVSTVASAAFGFLFWVVAARWFPAGVVGQASALVSAMTLLASLAQLNLVSLFARFLPTAGGRTSRIVLSGYVASVAMAVALCAGLWAWGWRPPFGLALFTAAVVATALLFISDGVLAAFGRAAWVPIKNVLTSGGKLALLGGLAGAAAITATGLFVAWVVPVFVAAAVVTWWVFSHLVPAHAARTTGVAAGGGTLGFVSAEYVNGVISNAVAFVPPVLVAAALGDLASAYFYVPWLVGVSLSTLLWNIVTSYVVAASGPGADGRAALARAVRLGTLVVLPAAVVLAVAADPLLRVLGPAYAAEGAPALRLIGLSLPGTAVVLLYAAFSVMAKGMWPLAGIQLTAAAVFLGGSWLTVDRLGLVGPAMIYLGTQTAAACAVAPAVLRRYRAALA